MTKKLFLTLFISILFIGTLLRFVNLGSIPGSLEWDEASFGYNAYSILHTGKDEYGISYPFTFRAFGEYKQPVYAYLDVASVGLFGLNAFAVRFPSALFGSLSIVFIYLLVNELFRKQHFRKSLALLSMACFALSPWSIQFSRGAFESNVALCLVIAGVWLFLKGIFTQKNWQLFLGTVLLLVSEYTYISEKVVVPFLFMSLIIFSFAYLKKRRNVMILLIAVFLLGNLLVLFNLKSVSRGQDVLFTGQQAQLLQTSIKELQYDKEHGDIIGQIIHNRRVVYVQKFSENYLSHFNPNWLFVKGDSANRHHAPGMGILYLISLPFILLGIYFLLRTFSVSWILFVWLLIAPIPAALSSDAPHALRSLISLPTWHIFEAAGIIFLFQLITKKRLVRIATILVVTFYTLNIVYYLHQYFVHTNTEFQKDWQYGYKEAMLFAAKEKSTVVFANTFEQPYIFYLFYNQYDPAKYLTTGGSERTQERCYTIDNSYFGNCEDKLKKGDSHVVIGTDAAEKGAIVQQIRYTSGEPAVTVYKHL